LSYLACLKLKDFPTIPLRAKVYISKR